MDVKVTHLKEELKVATTVVMIVVVMTEEEIVMEVTADKVEVADQVTETKWEGSKAQIGSTRVMDLTVQRKPR